MKWPNHVLMVEPTYFDVEYAINPHMLDKKGALKKVNKSLAHEQWLGLKKTFVELGLKVDVLKGELGLPDMVFTANQTFPFLSGEKSQIVLSKMFSEKRQGEVSYFKDWAQKKNIETYELKSNGFFEGMGDALWNYESEEIYGGYGFRTSKEIYKEVAEIIKNPVIPLKLINEDFYHLDTCLAIANKDTAFAVFEGFDMESINKLKENFKHLVQIPLCEAKGGFAANLCCVNGTDIIIQRDNDFTSSCARELGLSVHEIETTEFMKSGGSVFCMKQLYWSL